MDMTIPDGDPIPMSEFTLGERYGSEDMYRDFPELVSPLTWEQRMLLWYKQIAGQFPGPNRATIAAMLAYHIVRLEDEGNDEKAPAD